MKQEMMWWQWHQLDYMRIICILLQTDITQFFYRLDAVPDAQQTVSKH